MTGRSSTISYAAMVNKNVAKLEEITLTTTPVATNQSKKSTKSVDEAEQPKEEFPQLNKSVESVAQSVSQQETVAESKSDIQQVSEESKQVITEDTGVASDDNNGEFIEKKKREKKDNKQRNNRSNNNNNNRRPPPSARPQQPRSAGAVVNKKSNESTNQAQAVSVGEASTEVAQAQASSSAPRRDSSEVAKTFGEKFDEEKAKYLERFKDVKDYCFKLVKGDLFSADENVSLGHCVSEDFTMTRGIATEFKKRYGNIDVLLEQKTRTGGCAYLKDNDRYLFYLVTKKYNSHKPYYNSVEKSLKEMRSLCKRFQVKDLAMPMIGTGLDRLEWKIVSAIIDFVFRKENINITIYKFEKNRQQGSYNNSKTPSSSNQATTSS